MPPPASAAGCPLPGRRPASGRSPDRAARSTRPDVATADRAPPVCPCCERTGRRRRAVPLPASTISSGSAGVRRVVEHARRHHAAKFLSGWGLLVELAARSVSDAFGFEGEMLRGLSSRKHHGAGGLGLFEYRRGQARQQNIRSWLQGKRLTGGLQEARLLGFGRQVCVGNGVSQLRNSHRSRRARASDPASAHRRAPSAILWPARRSGDTDRATG